jgi:hypothetical protein
MKVRELRTAALSLGRPVPTESDQARVPEDRYQGTTSGTAPPPARPSPDAHRTASELVDAGRIDEAIATLRGLADDRTRSPDERANAAAWLGILIRRDRPSAAAEMFELASAVAPNAAIVGWLSTELAIDRGDVTAALACSEKLVREQPNDPFAHRARSSALLADAQAQAALASAERAVELAGDPRFAAEHRLLLGVAYAAAFANQPQRVVSAAQESLRHKPHDGLMHTLVGEFLVPSFEGPHRRSIEAKFERANRRYQQGDYETVKNIALDVLSIDPQDGLAHALYGIAAKAQRVASRPLVEAIDSEEKRRQLIGALESAAARATVKGRPGRPSDLFPDWLKLNEVQKATVAASALPYGIMIPRLIEQHAVYRFALPGTSCADASIDPNVRRSDELGLGRHFYALRGRAKLGDQWVVSGVEEIDFAARGEYNTITHELAHLVHVVLLDLAAKRDNEHDLSKLDFELSLFPLRIDSAYRNARMKRNGEQLLDAYSGSNVYECFAQGIMSCLALSPEGSMQPEKLLARNPSMYKTSIELLERLRFAAD